MNAVSLVSLEDAAKRADHAISYREFLPASRSALQPPAFIFGTLPAYLTPDLFSEHELGSVGCYRIRNGRVTSDGVVLRAGEAFWSAAWNHPDYLVRNLIDPAGNNRGALPVRRLAGQVAIIHGPGYMVFGHWLVDVLPRLYVLHCGGYDVGRLQFLLPADTPQFGFDFLRSIGIINIQIIRHHHNTELVEADEVLVPTILRLKSRLHPCFAEATKFWCDRFCAGAAITRPVSAERRIFISREHAASQRLVENRGQIQTMAQQAGYELLHPERLSLADQIQIFSQSARIVGEYGSGLHNCMFSPPGAQVCALRGTSHSPGFVQSSLAEVFGQHVGYVLAPTPEHSDDQRVTIDPGLFGRALDSLDASPRAALPWPAASAAPIPQAEPAVTGPVGDMPRRGALLGRVIRWLPGRRWRGR